MTDLASPTVSVEHTAELLGVSSFAAYRQAREEGHIGGIPVLRIGRRMVVPRIPLERALQGLPPVPPETSPSPQAEAVTPEPPAAPHPAVAPAGEAHPPAVAELGSGATPTP